MSGVYSNTTGVLMKKGTFGPRDRNAKGECNRKTRGRRAFASPGPPGATRGSEQGLEHVLPSWPSSGSHADNTFNLDFKPPALGGVKFLLFKPLSLENQCSHQPKRGSSAVVHPSRGVLAESVSSQRKQLQTDEEGVKPCAYVWTHRNTRSSFCKHQ